MEKTKILKTIDLIITLGALGFIVYYFISAKYPSHISTILKNSGNTKDIITQLLGAHFTNYLLILTVLFADRTRKRAISGLFLIGEIVLSIAVIIYYRQPLLDVFTMEHFGTYLAITYIVNTTATFLLFMGILAYIIKKDKKSVFAKIYIFTLPVIKLLCLMQIIRLDSDTFKPIWDPAYYIGFIKNSWFSIIIWTLLATVLFIRYRIHSNRDV